MHRYISTILNYLLLNKLNFWEVKLNYFGAFDIGVILVVCTVFP